MILGGSSAGAMARESDRGAAAGGRGRKRRGGGAPQKKAGPAASPRPGGVRDVVVGGRPMQVSATAVPPAGVPGGGDEEAERLVAEGGVLAMRGDWDGARRRLKAVLARFPGHYIANYNMGMGWRMAGRPRIAIKYLKRAIRAWPENHIAHSGMGRVLLDMGEYDKALAAIDRSLEIQPGNSLALRDRDEALAALGRRRP